MTQLRTPVESVSLMADSLPVLIAYLDAEQRFRYCNSAYERWFLSAPSSTINQPLREVLGEATYGRLSEYIEATQAGRQVSCETYFDLPCGDTVFAHVIFVPTIGPNGRTQGFYTLMTDISKLHQSKQALNNSEALYFGLVEHLPMCILRKDATGRITFGNSTFFEFAKLRPDDVIGKSDFDLFPAELAQKYRDDDLQVMQTRSVIQTIERNQVGPGGADRYVEILKTPVYDASRNVIGSQVIFWDVTEKHLTEVAVKESAALKRAIFDCSLDCIVIIDQEGKIIDFNRATERVFGYRREALVGLSIDDTLFPPALKDRQRSNRDRYDSEREEGSMVGKRLEVHAMHADGRVFDVEMAMQPIPYEGRSVFAMFLHDITARKEAEREIATKNKDLETLLYVTSHDLREPLRAIQSFSELFVSKVGAKISDTERGYLDRVQEGAKRLDRLLNDVLMLSRAQRATEDVGETNSRIILDDVIRELDVRLAETHGTIHVADDLPNVRVDPRWLRQTLYNLLVNALKFTCEGQHPEVDVVRYEPGPGDLPGVGFVVRDRGPGVDPEHSERIFQLFQRAVSRKVEGTGAGLAIVRQVANRYGGNAWHKPREGGGSQFFLVFAH